ncbi:hypothetical protein MMC32_007015 [Xylographa parallela]|nr:hypothetical protein [Xylographa parallela]
MSFTISPSQTDYLVSLILKTTGHRHFLPGLLMNPLDWDILPDDKMEFVPFPLFEGQRQQRPSDAVSQYRRAVANLRTRIENLEDEIYSESETVHDSLDGSSLDSEIFGDTVGPQLVRGGVLLADNYQEMSEQEFQAHHSLLDNYRIKYRRYSSITTSPPSPRTIVTNGQDRRNSVGDRHLSEARVDDPPRLPCRSMILEPLHTHDFVVEFPSGEIDTFYTSIFGVICSGG